MSPPSRPSVARLRCVWLTLPLVAAACRTPDASATVVWGELDLKGSFGADVGGAVETTTLEALGVSGKDSNFLPRVDFDWEGVHLSLSGIYLDRTGEGELEAELEVGGTVFTGSTPVRSRLDMDLFTAAVTWDVLPSRAVELAFGLGAHVIDLDATIEDLTTSEALRSHNRFPVPVLVARANFVDWPVGAGVTYTALDVDLAGVEVETSDLDIFVEWRAWGDGKRDTGYLVAAYRKFDLFASYLDQDSSIEMDFDAEALTIGLRMDF